MADESEDLDRLEAQLKVSLIEVKRKKAATMALKFAEENSRSAALLRESKLLAERAFAVSVYAQHANATRELWDQAKLALEDSWNKIPRVTVHVTSMNGVYVFVESAYRDDLLELWRTVQGGRRF